MESPVIVRKQIKIQPLKLHVDHSRCILCFECAKACPEKAIHLIPNPACAKCVKYCFSIVTPCEPDILVISHDRCNNCGICIDVCAQNAISW